MAVDESDLCDAGYGERLDNFLKQFGGDSADRRARVYDLAHQAAVGEMLTEIHFMLRRLTQSKP